MWRAAVIGLSLLVPLVSQAGPVEWSRHEPEAVPDVVVYYFHSHIRCQTCRDMESMAAETVDVDFRPEVESGVLGMRTIDVENPGQEHYAAEFNVTGPTLVVADLDDSGNTASWRGLDRIWELAEAPVAYRAYVRGAIQAALNGDLGQTKTDPVTTKGTP